MNEGISRGVEWRRRPGEGRGADSLPRKGGKREKDDVVGTPVFIEAPHVRTRPEVMRAQLEAEAREQSDREASERTERLRQVTDRFVREDAVAYAQQMKREQLGKITQQKEMHEQALREIHTEMSDLLSLRRTQKEKLWSFLPQRQREIAKIDEEVAELRTRARIEQMRIAEISGEFHKDAQGSRKARVWELPEEMPTFTNEEIDTLSKGSAVDRESIRALMREKVALEAEREGWIMFARPFRKHAIEAELERITQEINRLQRKVRSGV